MTRALIVASVGVLASTVWVVSANAQANLNPNVYPGNTSGPYGGQWQAVGPMKQGAMCRTEVDPGRGYGYMKPCPAPQGQAAQKRAPRRAAVR